MLFLSSAASPGSPVYVVSFSRPARSGDPHTQVPVVAGVWFPLSGTSGIFRCRLTPPRGRLRSTSNFTKTKRSPWVPTLSPAYPISVGGSPETNLLKPEVEGLIPDSGFPHHLCLFHWRLLPTRPGSTCFSPPPPPTPRVRRHRLPTMLTSLLSLSFLAIYSLPAAEVLLLKQSNHVPTLPKAFQWPPLVFRMRPKFPVGAYKDTLTSLQALSLWAPHRPASGLLSLPWNTPSSFLPQGLCTRSAVGLESYFPVAGLFSFRSGRRWNFPDLAD